MTSETAHTPRERLLDAASELFYRHGIGAVGVDLIVSTASVTRATFYRHFPSKEDLVVAYLEREDREIRTRFTDLPEPAGASPVALLAEAIADDVSAQHNRGCPFINAAAEYPSPASPVRQVITQHRNWFHQALVSLCELAELDDPEQCALRLSLLRDGALVAGYLDDWARARPAFISAALAVTGQ